MDRNNIPFQTIDWSAIPKIEHKGKTGSAVWQTLQHSGLRIRIVEYSSGYVADHWCSKGHVVHCLHGQLTSELNDGRSFELKEGMSYVVSDDMGSHRSSTRDGATLLIIDGEFLGKKKL